MINIQTPLNIFLRLALVLELILPSGFSIPNGDSSIVGNLLFSSITFLVLDIVFLAGIIFSVLDLVVAGIMFSLLDVLVAGIMFSLLDVVVAGIMFSPLDAVLLGMALSIVDVVLLGMALLCQIEIKKES